jgi:hypothetical protein
LPPVGQGACPAEVHHRLQIATVAADRMWREPSLVSKMIEKLRNERESVSVQSRVVSSGLCAGCRAKGARIATKKFHKTNSYRSLLALLLHPSLCREAGGLCRRYG